MAYGVNMYGRPEEYGQIAPRTSATRDPYGTGANTAQTIAPTPGPPIQYTGTAQPAPQQPAQQQTAQPAPQQTSTLASRYPTIVANYREYLGRDPSEAEIAGATGGGSWAPTDPRITSSLNAIRYSQEAQRRAQAPAQTTQTTTTASGWGTAPPDGNWEGWFWNNVKTSGGRLSSSQLKALEPELAKAGVKVYTNANGVTGKIILPNGQAIDVIQGAEGGGDTPQWLTGGGATAPTTWGANGPVQETHYSGPTTPMAPLPTRPTLPTTPYAVYQPGQVTQFQAPEYGGLDTRTQAVIDSLLGSDVLSPEILEQMKSRNREEGISYGQNLQDQLLQSAASRGTMQGGTTGDMERQIGEDVIAKILAGNRDIDIQAPQINRTGKENAVGLANNFLNDLMSRATSGYSATLAGQTAQEGLNQAGVQSQNAAQQAELDRLLAGAGLDLDWWKAGEAGRQGDIGSALDWASLNEQARQFNRRLGFDYSNQNNALIQWIIANALGA